MKMWEKSLIFRLTDEEVNALFQFILEQKYQFNLPTGDYPIKDEVKNIWLDENNRICVEVETEIT